MANLAAIRENQWDQVCRREKKRSFQFFSVQNYCLSPSICLWSLTIFLYAGLFCYHFGGFPLTQLNYSMGWGQKELKGTSFFSDCLFHQINLDRSLHCCNFFSLAIWKSYFKLCLCLNTFFPSVYFPSVF